MGAPGNQQAPFAHNSAKCAIQVFRNRPPWNIRRPGRANSVLAAAICVACRRAQRSSTAKSATKTFFPRSILILRPATVFTYRFARKPAKFLRTLIDAYTLNTKIRRSFQQYSVCAINRSKLIFHGTSEMERIAGAKKYHGIPLLKCVARSSSSNCFQTAAASREDRCFSPKRRFTAE
jgi:hypothetical protein